MRPRWAGTARRGAQVVALTTVALTVSLALVLASWGAATGVRLARPWALLPLVGLPWLVWRAARDGARPRLRWGDARPLARGPRGLRARLAELPSSLRLAGFVAALIALAQPVRALEAIPTEEQGIDLIFVIDLSASMRAVVAPLPADLEARLPGRERRALPTRLEAAKAVLDELCESRTRDRVGAVVFGREAFVVAPPTFDRALVRELVAGLELGLVDGGASSLGDALGVAASKLRGSTAASRAVILLSDGEHNAGALEPEQAAELVAKVGARLYAVQVGDGDTARVLDSIDASGRARYRPAPFEADPARLQRLAAIANGQAFVASDAEALRASLGRVLDGLETSALGATELDHAPLHRAWLVVALALVGLELSLRHLVLRGAP